MFLNDNAEVILRPMDKTAIMPTEIEREIVVCCKMVIFIVYQSPYFVWDEAGE
jgi:hypothetical protein